MSFRRSKPLSRVLLSLFSLAVLGFALSMTACGGTTEQPTVASFSPRPTPTSASRDAPTPAPTPTPTVFGGPHPLPSEPAVPITEWELDEISTGSDLVNLLSDDERICLQAALGDQHGAFLSTAYSQLWNETTSPVLEDCLTPESNAGIAIALFSATAGGLSAETRNCLADVFAAGPHDAPAFSAGVPSEAAAGAVSFDALSCLTPEEAAAMTPGGDGPPPDTAGLRCVTEALMELDGGDEVVRIISTADPTGLAPEQSALLGEAVRACDIETEFTFLDPGSTDSLDPAETGEQADAPEGSEPIDEGTDSAGDPANTGEGTGAEDGSASTGGTDSPSQ